MIHRFTNVAFLSFVLSVALLMGTDLALRAHAQQPSEQGPPPATCEQALRENSAYRDRIASLERQVDATNEEAKTFYMRAETWFDAYRSALRLADHYRNEAAALRADLAAARAEAPLGRRRPLPAPRRRR